MDYETRIGRVEAQLEMNQKDIERLYQAISELRGLMLERFDQVDLRFSEERKQTDLSVSGLQAQIGGLQVQISVLQTQVNVLQTQISDFQAQLNEMRREATLNMRWMMGMWFFTISMIVGLGGKVFGVY